MAPLLNLPVEIILTICCALDSVNDTLNLASTCQTLINIWKSNTSMIIENVLPRQVVGHEEARRLADAQTRHDAYLRSTYLHADVEFLTTKRLELMQQRIKNPEKGIASTAEQEQTLENDAPWRVGRDEPPLVGPSISASSEKHLEALEYAKLILRNEREAKWVCSYAQQAGYGLIFYGSQDIIESYYIIRLCVTGYFMPELRDEIEAEFSRLRGVKIGLCYRLMAWLCGPLHGVVQKKLGIGVIKAPMMGEVLSDEWEEAQRMIWRVHRRAHPR